MTDELERHDYRCTVTLLLDDVCAETARKFFAEGFEVEGCPPYEGVIASIEAPGPIEVQP